MKSTMHKEEVLKRSNKNYPLLSIDHNDLDLQITISEDFGKHEEYAVSFDKKDPADLEALKKLVFHILNWTIATDQMTETDWMCQIVGRD